jgi:hypothetical protein
MSSENHCAWRIYGRSLNLQWSRTNSGDNGANLANQGMADVVPGRAGYGFQGAR